MIDVRPGGAAAYLTTPLLAFAAALPWLSQSATAGWVAPASLSAVLLIALAIVRPRVQRVPLDVACTLKLAPANEAEDAGYEVVLSRGSQSQILLRHASLSVVARDLGRILDVTRMSADIPGISPEYFLSSGEPSRREREGVTTVEGLASMSHRRAARAVVGGTLFTAFVFGWSLLKAESPVSVLSFALPAVTLLLLGAFGAWMSAKRSWVRVSDSGLEVEERSLRIRRRVLSIPAHELLGAVVVERGGAAVEVLFATTRGPRVLPLVGDAARRITAVVGPIAADAPRDAAVPLPSNEGGGAFEPRSTAGRALESRRDPRRGKHPEIARARQP